MDFEPSKFKREGLYLIFKNLKHIAFTDENINKITTYYWKDTSKISKEIRKSIEFQKCNLCPIKKIDCICPAIKPILPLIDFVKDYNSFDEITAVYNSKNMFNISYTTMQEALKYLSIISLFDYCEVGKLYKKYYYGIIPLCDSKTIAKKIYLNMFFINSQKYKKSMSLNDYYNKNKEFIEEFISKITIISKNQIKRIQLVCATDAFINAYVNTQISTVLMSINVEKNIMEEISRNNQGEKLKGPK